MEINLKEIEVQKLNLQPGEVLIITIKMDDLNRNALNSLAEQFRNLLPNNKVAVLSVGENDDIKLTTVKSEDMLNSCNTCLHNKGEE